MIDLRSLANLETLILTGIMFPGLAALSILWIKGKLRGHEITYTTRSIRTHSSLVFLSVFMSIFFLVKFGSLLKQYTWIVPGFLLSFLLGTVFNFLYVMKLERKLGQRIVEKKEG